MSTAPSSSSQSSPVVEISLRPRAGFCIKTNTLEGATLPTPNGKSGATTPVPAGLKVFMNIAWDPNVPPSPPGSEEAIERVVSGEADGVEEDDVNGLFIPAIVSPPREDRDKAGNPSIVFDCIYNTTVRARVLGNEEYKAFIVELALQRIEAQTGLILSREIRTPNIASKGKLLPRTAKVPASLLLETPAAQTQSPEHASSEQNTTSKPKPSPKTEDEKTEEESHEAFSQAILQMLKALPTTETEPVPEKSSEELPSSSSTPSPPSLPPSSCTDQTESPTKEAITKAPAPQWSYRKEENGRLQIKVNIPELTPELVTSATLDVEERRIVLSIPNRDPLDINLALSDADIEKHWTDADAKWTSTAPVNGDDDLNGNGNVNGKGKEEKEEEEEIERTASNVRETLNLKRERDLDVEGAEAEWRVGSGVLVIRV